MANIKFDIERKLDNSNYYYRLYEDGKETKHGFAEYTHWDEKPEHQEKWKNAVNAYNKEHNVPLPSNDLKEQLADLKAQFAESGDNMPTKLDTGLMGIPAALATMKTDLDKFLDNIITACKKGPTMIKDTIFNRINVEKTNLITKAKSAVHNYNTVMGMYLEPIESQIGEYNLSLDEYDAAQEAWRKKYSEELYSFNIVLAEGDPMEIQQVETTTDPSEVLGSSDTYSEDNDNTESSGDIFTDLGNMTYYSSTIPTDIQKQMDKVFKSRFNSTTLPNSIKDRFMNYKSQYFDGYFTQNGVPKQMEILSIIETNCNPQTGSKENSCTALGIWQFTRATGSGYKLLKGYWMEGKSKNNQHNFIITSNYDYRTDISKESEAAAKLIKNIHNKYVHNWILTAASYNWGPGNVQKAVKKYGSNIWTLLSHFPTETKNYCLLLLKICQILNYPTDPIINA